VGVVLTHAIDARTASTSPSGICQVAVTIDRLRQSLNFLLVASAGPLRIAPPLGWLAWRGDDGKPTREMVELKDLKGLKKAVSLL
jgi:hypothetical protein